MTAASRLEATTLDLFQRMEEAGLRYAFLRNYETFPSFRSDIDLVVDAGDVARWRAIAADIAREHGWDALTECDHWSRSSAPHHRIETFCFHHVADDAYLPIDLFHGLLLWGLPVFTEADLLAGRQRDNKRGITRIDPTIENFERILQIYNLHRKGGNDEKIIRYRRRVLDFCTDFEAPLRELARQHLGPSGADALDHLKRNDMSRFARSVERGKRHFLSRYAARHPASAARYILARGMEYRRLYLSHQCGFPLRVHAPDASHKRALSEALNAIVAANGLRGWTTGNAERSNVGWREHKVMEQGGLAIKWADLPATAGVTVLDGESAQAIRETIASLLIERHQPLYRASAAAGSPAISQRIAGSPPALTLDPRR